jgi:hypothetical protein
VLSKSNIMSARHLNKNEVELLTFMLVNTDHAQKFTQSVNNLLVEEMEDGGMGSLRFISEGEGKFGSVAVEKDFMDVDGIPVFVSIYINNCEKSRLSLQQWQLYLFYRQIQ